MCQLAILNQNGPVRSFFLRSMNNKLWIKCSCTSTDFACDMKPPCALLGTALWVCVCVCVCHSNNGTHNRKQMKEKKREQRRGREREGEGRDGRRRRDDRGKGESG